MNIRKKSISIILFFALMSSFMIGNVNAEEAKFGISLNLYESPDDNTFDYSKDIMFILTVSNNYDHWVSIGGEYRNEPNFQINIVDSPTGDKLESYNQFFGNIIFIEPKSEFKMYIPFKLYNNMEHDERVGDWKIQPKLTLNNFKLYKSPFESDEISLFNIQKPKTNIPMVGNTFEFKTIKPNVEIESQTESYTNFQQRLVNLWNINPDLSVTIIGGIIVVVVGGILLKRD